MLIAGTFFHIGEKSKKKRSRFHSNHRRPVFVGDTLYVQTEVLECRESRSKNDRGIIYVETIAYNQLSEEVLKFRRNVLIMKRGE